MNSISFDNVYLLFIALPLAALFAVPFFIAVRRENANGHNIASLVLHILMAALIAFAAAGTTITAVLTETQVYVVADVSYSANKNLDIVDDYIKNLDLPDNSKVGLICFGKDYQLLNSPTKKSKISSVKTATVDDSETNICEALEYAGTLFKDDAIKRIVLITDGKQSDARDDYSLKRVVDELSGKNIVVDSIFLDDNMKLDGSVKEVQISSVDFTSGVFLDSDQKATVTVQSSYAPDSFTLATVTLFCNDAEVRRESVRLSAGTNLVQFSLDTSAEGVFDYEVKVEGVEDGSAHNNSFSFTQTVSGDMNVLVVTNEWDDVKLAVQRYGSKAKLDIYENDQGVRRSEKNSFINQHTDPDIVFNISTSDVPTSVEQLSKYDEVVVSNVDICTLNNYTEFVTSLDTVVNALGKSLVTYGDLSIQNRDDEELVKLENLLPVNFGNNSGDPRLYTIVIDSSRSMGRLFHLIVAKQLAVRLLDLLDEKDQICVVTFNGDVEVVQPVVPLTIQNKSRVIERINNLDDVQGTVIGKGLRRAYELISPLNTFSDRQVMLITDGLTFGDDEPANLVARDMYSEGIVTSVFDVGRQGDGENGVNPDATATAAKTLLENVAREGNGNRDPQGKLSNYTYSRNVENLSDVTFGKIADSITESVIERRTSVNVEIRTDDVLEDIDAQSIPDVSGYVYSTQKPSARTVLTVNHQNVNGTVVERPLYAYWNSGNGRVATFTSSFTGDWAQLWISSDLQGGFYDNIFDTCQPKEVNSAPFTVQVERAGTYSLLTITPATPRFDASLDITVALPDGTPVQADVSYNSYYYYAEIYTSEVGKYDISFNYNFSGNEYTSNYAVTVSYSDEYDEFAVYDATVLHKAIDGEGTVLDGRNPAAGKYLKIENDEKYISTYTLNLTLPLMIVTVVLFIVDIVIRKLKWEDIVSFFGLHKKRGGKAK